MWRQHLWMKYSLTRRHQVFRLLLLAHYYLILYEPSSISVIKLLISYIIQENYQYLSIFPSSHCARILFQFQIQDLQNLKMKKLVNPTTYFFQQAQQIPSKNSPQIDEFVKKLLNKDQCQLCRKPYDIHIRIPRILIHCGHTFCSLCLHQFFTKNRVRCPMCLKLVKKLGSLERLPINHSIFAYLTQKQKKQNENKSGTNKPIHVEDASKFLYAEFERVQKQAHRQQNPQKYDDESGLPFCVFHSDRVQHFYCQSHKSFGCRVCIQIGHSKSDCQVVDLYTVDNPSKYQNLLEARIEETYPTGCMNPFNIQKYNSFGNPNKTGDRSDIKLDIENPNWGKGNFGFNNILDPTLIDDEESEEGQNRSF